MDSFTSHYLGSPMSWKPSSAKVNDPNSLRDHPMHDIADTFLPSNAPASSTSTSHMSGLHTGSPMSWKYLRDHSMKEITDQFVADSFSPSSFVPKSHMSQLCESVSASGRSSSAILEVDSEPTIDNDNEASSNDNLLLSFSVKTTKSNFKCPLLDCSLSFVNISQLEFHMKYQDCFAPPNALHPEPWFCHVCRLPFATLNVMEAHVQSSHNAEPVPKDGPVDLTARVIRDKSNLHPVHGGSYADIYKSACRRRDSTYVAVAVKVIRAHIYKEASQDRLHKRLAREIKIWTGLRHPNVLPLLGTASNFGPLLSMVCPWMAQGDLATYIRTNQTVMTWKDRLSICRGVANGLSYMHSQSFIHQDLTTVRTKANILMDEEGIPKLSDFGLSNIVAELRGASFMTSKMAGSARWAAPELFNDDIREASFETDVYSLGSVMFHVMSGKVPYEGLTETQVMLQVLTKKQPSDPWQGESSTVTGMCWDIINKCWFIDPNYRPSLRQVDILLTMALKNGHIKINRNGLIQD